MGCRDCADQAGLNLMPKKPDIPLVLLTGASSGIGLSLAEKLSRLPYRVIATARESSLASLHSAGLGECENIIIRSMDVTIDEQRKSVVNEAEEKWGGIDILINNAGISYRAVVEHMTEEDEHLQLDTNFHGPMAMIRLVLPRMRREKAGRIINISSVGRHDGHADNGLIQRL